ncbi:MAG: iron ABC transporter substrate-binding protein [Clostridiales bacterium]|nr:iron ABC transporter substrate-binding protein [Clostridiales bacterium]
MKRNTKLLALIMSAVLTIAVFAGCSAKPAESAAPSDSVTPSAADTAYGTRKIVDSYGRTVEVPTTINKILPFGSSSLRLVCYLGAEDMVNCVDESQQDPKTINVAIPYKQVFADKFADLPVVGKYSGGYITYNEEIIAAAPDVIIVSYFDLAQIETLQEQTGIPVVGIKCAKGMFADDLTYSLTLLGDLLGKQDRATELNSYISEIKEDLNTRTKDIPESEKKTVYSGAMSYYGQHGIQGTMAGYPQIAAINAINVADAAADKASESGTFEADIEKIQEWNPDIIFLDPFNMSLVNEEYKQNPVFFELLDAVKNGQIYAQVAFIRDGFNVELGLIDCYYAGICVYPEQFSDVDIAVKAKEIFEKFLGEDIYSQYAPAGLAFDKIKIGK